MLSGIDLDTPVVTSPFPETRRLLENEKSVSPSTYDLKTMNHFYPSYGLPEVHTKGL